MPVNYLKIKELRLAAGLSQDEAGQRAGAKAPHAWWSRIERGAQDDVGVVTLERIAAVLGVKAKDLLV